MCAFRPNTLLFGSNLAVLAYNTVSRVVSILLCKFFKAPGFSYFDDFSGAAPAELEGLPLECFEALNAVLGLRIKKEKSSLGHEIPFLGLMVSETHDGFEISLPEEKRVAYKAKVDELLESKYCSQSDADSIFGKLQFCETTVFGRANRIFLVPIYLQKTSSTPRVGPRLERALCWLSNFLTEPKTRVYRRPANTVHAVVFSDASLTALGAVICLPGGERLEFAPIVPPDFANRLSSGENVIFTLEIIAAMFAAEKLAEKKGGGRLERHFPGR